jgi:uncharacterized phage protein (TIGR02218 family)
MRTLSSNDTQHAAQQVTTWARCVHVVDANGNEGRFTDHDVSILVSRSGDPLGINGYYDPIKSISASALRSTADMAVDNQSSEITLDEFGISAADIRAGLYDDVRVTLFMVNWRNPTDSGIILKHGPFGHKELADRGVASVELLGLTQYLQKSIVDTYSASCRADLGSQTGRWPCKLNLTPFIVSTTVSSVQSARIAFTASALAISPSQTGYYTGGLVTFTATGYRREVRSDNGNGALVLFEPLPSDIQVGDAFTLYPGCDKSRTTCRDKFNNVVNFRGEPFIPAPTNLTSGA